jgi:hypothetical protein
VATVGEVTASASAREDEGACEGARARAGGDGEEAGQIGRRRKEGETESAYEET